MTEKAPNPTNIGQLTPEQEAAIDDLVDNKAHNYTEARLRVLGASPVENLVANPSAEPTTQPAHTSRRPVRKETKKLPPARTAKEKFDRDMGQYVHLKPFPYGTKDIDDYKLN